MHSQVAGPPANLTVTDIHSRSFRIEFGVPVNPNGALEGYKILVSSKYQCIQQINVHNGSCLKCVVRTSKYDF